MTRIEIAPFTQAQVGLHPCFSSTSKGMSAIRRVAEALAALEQRASLFKVLGSYPRAVL